MCDTPKMVTNTPKVANDAAAASLSDVALEQRCRENLGRAQRALTLNERRTWLDLARADQAVLEARNGVVNRSPTPEPTFDTIEDAESAERDFRTRAYAAPTQMEREAWIANSEAAWRAGQALRRKAAGESAARTGEWFKPRAEQLAQD